MPVSDLSSECGVCRPVRLGLWPGPASAEAAPPHPSQLCSSHLPASVTLASLTISLGDLHRWGLTRALGTRMSMWLEPELIRPCDPRPESACIVRNEDGDPREIYRGPKWRHADAVITSVSGLSKQKIGSERGHCHCHVFSSNTDANIFI